MVARAALRQLLGEVLGRPAASLRLTTSPTGRPLLDDEPSWWFNVTHTTDLTLIALHPYLPVGIDIEPRRRTIDAEVMRRVCTPQELAELAAHPPAERARHCLHLWVRKEAVAKADGRGLSLVLARLDARRPGSVAVPGAPGEQVHVDDLDVGEEHVAAIATVGDRAPVKLRWWAEGRVAGSGPADQRGTGHRPREVAG